MSAVGRDSRKVRAAVVGTGEFGRNHARVYRELEGAELVGVYDRDPARAEAVAVEFQTRALRSLEEVSELAEAASVAVPTVAHVEVGCRLLENGLDILVEKPMALNLEEADALLEAGRRDKRILQGGNARGFNPAGQPLDTIL